VDVKRTVVSAVITAGVGMSAFMFGTGSVSAVPLDPPPPPSPVGPAPDEPPAAGPKIARTATATTAGNSLARRVIGARRRRELNAILTVSDSESSCHATS